MASRTDLDLDLEERCRLLDEWVGTRREIARLEAKAANLLAERVGIYEADVAEAAFHRDAIHRSMVSEYAAAGRISKGTMEFAFTDARALRDTFPQVREAFEAGLITAGHVREIIRAGDVLVEAVRHRNADAETLDLYATAALVIAEHDTPARTRAHAQQVASALAGETVNERHLHASHERSVTVRPVGDGLALLSVVLPEYLAVAIHDRLTQMARHIINDRDAQGRHTAQSDGGHGGDVSTQDDCDERRAGRASSDAGTAGSRRPIYAEDFEADDPRLDLPSFEHPVRSDSHADGVIFGETDTFTTDPHPDPHPDPAPRPDDKPDATDTRGVDEVRADLLTDLLLTGDPTAAHGPGLENITARIQVTIAATTLTGADDRPAELDGHGPLHPDIARDLAGHTTGWARLFLDPVGMIIRTDNYTPTAAMRRHLRARDQHCRFPGCRMPAHTCQIDHNHDHAKGGPTSIDNLSHFCLAHHALKHPDVHHRHRWTAEARTDGTIEWTSPLGRTYTDPPPRRVMFT